jgi:hypothetical protein
MKPENVVFIAFAIWLTAFAIGSGSAFKHVSVAQDALEWAEMRNGR